MLPAPVELPTTVNHWLISNLKLPGKHAIPIDMNELEAGQKKNDPSRKSSTGRL